MVGKTHCYNVSQAESLKDMGEKQIVWFKSRLPISNYHVINNSFQPLAQAKLKWTIVPVHYSARQTDALIRSVFFSAFSAIQYLHLDLCIGLTRTHAKYCTANPDLITTHGDGTLKILTHAHAKLQLPLAICLLVEAEFLSHQIPLLS